MKHPPSDSIERFSNTVENYAKYRPNYPGEVIELLKNECGIKNEATIADIGSGTGIFAKLLLDHGYKVLGIEPNQDMRNKAEQLLLEYSEFTSISATAETTGLANHSVDAITAATAFHWFDPEKTRPEFCRILKPNGWCILLWNIRPPQLSPLMAGYEILVKKYGIDYDKVAAEKSPEDSIRQFFKPNNIKIMSFPNQQILDWEGFKGRILSSSYSPKPGHQNYEAMIDAAHDLFNHYQREGSVEFIYKTKCYFGHLTETI